MNHIFNLAQYAEDDTVDTIAMESAYNTLDMFEGDGKNLKTGVDRDGDPEKPGTGNPALPSPR